jgi:hypothetical protein
MCSQSVGGAWFTFTDVATGIVTCMANDADRQKPP